MPISIFFTNIKNQTIMVNNEKKSKKANHAVTKLVKLILTFLICRYVQLFPPNAEGLCLSKFSLFLFIFLQYQNLYIKFIIKIITLGPLINDTEYSRPNYVSNEILVRKKKSWDNKIPAIVKSPEKEDSDKNLIDLQLPSGMKLNAAGQWTIFIVSLTCAAIYFCDRFSKIVLYICTRLNNTPEREDDYNRRE